MENVSRLLELRIIETDDFPPDSGRGKERAWYVNVSIMQPCS